MHTVRVFSRAVVFGFLLVFWLGVGFASSFVNVELPQNISFQMPRNWVVSSGTEMISLEAFFKSLMPQSTNDMSFQATLKNEKTQSIARLQVHYWKSEKRQMDIMGLLDFDLAAYNNSMRNQMTVQLHRVGSRMTSWRGTTKENINGLNVLISEYSRTSQSIAGHFRVQVLRIYCGLNSFSLLVSYHEEAILPLRPTVNKIISTLESDSCKDESV